MSILTEERIKKVDEINAKLAEAKHLIDRLREELFADYQLNNCRNALIRECAENVGWVEMCLEDEIHDHIYRAVHLLMEADE